MEKALISPSILAADFLNLGRDIAALNRSDCDWIHVDVMDGHFVPEVSFGQPVIRAIKKIAEKPLDVHLMIEDPLPAIESFVKAGADRLTFHLEAAEDPLAVIRKIHNCGLPAAMAIKPGTPVEEVEPFLSELDMVLIMTVEPGFGGQPILPETIDKIRRLSAKIREEGRNVLIEADGGIKFDNAGLLREAGLDVFVSGSCLFRGNPEENITEFIKRL